jgi:hypothetical protein
LRVPRKKSVEYHEELSGKVLRMAFSVHNILGPGLRAVPVFRYFKMEKNRHSQLNPKNFLY